MSADDRAVGHSLARQLIEDVIALRTQLHHTDSHLGRRNLVRATLSAAEGITWLAREHVLEIASTIGTITPLAEMAMREQAYFVTGDGVVVEQTRSVGLRTTVRLLERQARLIEPSLAFRYDHYGWEALRIAITVRDRVTHPKIADDLAITADEIAIVERGFHWLAATSEYILASTSQALRKVVQEHRSVLDALVEGDPDTLRAYEEVLKGTEGK